MNKVIGLWVFIRMIFVISFDDLKNRNNIFRIFENSVLRWYKHGFEFMFTKAADEYLELNCPTFPIHLETQNEKSDNNVLFIDAFTPSPSTDAGGYAAIWEIKLFQSLGYTVSFISLNESFDETERKARLDELGVTTLDAASLANQKYLLYNLNTNFKLVYITRYNVAEAFLVTLRWVMPNAKIILNLADLHYLREIRLAKADIDAIAIANKTKAIELKLIQKVDLTLSYSSYEIQVLKNDGINAEVLGLCPWVVSTPKVRIQDFNQRDGIAFLGGYRHVPNVEAVNWFVEKVWPIIDKNIPECKFYIYGSYSKEYLSHLENVRGIIIVGWVEDIADIYNSCRIFIAPLQSGAGVKGKVLSALAHGVPCVLSSIAAEGIPLVSGKQMLLAEHPTDWVEQIENIYFNQQQWAYLSHNGQKFALDKYSFEQGRALLASNIKRLY